MTRANKYKGKSHLEILHKIYQKALPLINEGTLPDLLNQLDDSEKSNLQAIADNCEKGKGVLAVLITSLTHKLHNPSQDIRLHQDNMDGGYSGRGIDTRYITPFMKEMEFPAMAESGWLTRSLEQNLPYDLNYPGKITPKELKAAFLNLLDMVQNQNRFPEKYLLVLFAKLIEHREQKKIDLAKPANLPISTIINYLKQHFESRYSSRGASRLPALAVYSVYQCMIKELKRCTHPIQRYYLLTTADEYLIDIENISKEVSRILKIHGCQVIINGIYPSLKYYLRLLHNTYDFIDNYVENLKKDKSIKYEHKLKWNEIVSQQVIENEQDRFNG